MLTKKELKYYSSLLNKKDRQEKQKFLVEGEKLIDEAIESNFICELIISSFNYAEKNSSTIKELQKRKIRTEIIKQNDFGKISDTKTPQGIVGVFQFPQTNSNIIRDDKLIVALENISDPGNLGTIIRNCDWFGIKNILLSPECAEIYNPKVIRASAGSVFHIGISELNDFYSELNNLKKLGYKILCADLNGENIFNFEQKKKFIVAFSNEAHGPSSKLLNITDHIITIPRLGKAESLNVASASAVILSKLTQ